ncbi:MAG: MBL fold metallo-hydrolase [Arenicella sp.]|jgi:phosphoribosyl 1,2-cyclic phosphodiesterase|nr:MBL fold metallo-hydrolase [Arenicella sp.]
MKNAIENMRIHFYGVQGSGAVFPRKRERDVIRQYSDIELLKKVFTRLSEESDDGVISLNAILNGAPDNESLSRFRDSLDPLEAAVYGGWTTCFRIETSDGYDIVIDCGSGFRQCLEDIEQKWGAAEQRTLYVLGTHAHFDHTEGFDQSGVCFDPRNHIHFFANRSYLMAMDRDLGLFSEQTSRKDEGRSTPLAYDMMPASFEATEIKDMSIEVPENDLLADHYQDIGQPFNIGKTTIQAFKVFHPDPCIAYRIEHNGKVFVFCTDHELRRGDDPLFHLQQESLAAEADLIEKSMNADVLYRDGQFLRDEYDAIKPLRGSNAVPRKDWGHSCIEDVVDMAVTAKVKRTYIGHHDPSRSWSELRVFDEMLEKESKAHNRHIEMAKAETVIDL